jgi:hypothetical protein
MTTNKIRKAAPAAIVAPAIAGFTAEQAASLRTAVTAAVVAGRKQGEADTAKGTATDKLIAALANPALLAHRFEFQARDRKGAVTETKQGSLYEYARKAPPFYTKGKEERARVTGFKAAFLAFAGINDATSAAATKAWDNAKGHALPAAIALADNLIAAKLVDGKLVLSGGNGTAVASGLLDAGKKSTKALVTKVKAKGTNSGSGKGKAPAAPAAKAPNDNEAAMRMALAYLRKVAAGDEAISNPRLSLLKGIAKAAADIIAQEAAAAAGK